MKTNPITAAQAYRQALDLVMKASTLHQARQTAAAALEVTFTAPESDQIDVGSGFGQKTRTPFVTIAMSSLAVQLASTQAREIGHQILEAADAADSDGFVVTFAMKRLGTSMEESAQLLSEFRAYRDQLRGASED
jgi:hypothetical protein